MSNPIDHLSAIFGSDADLARAAEVSPSTVWEWRNSNGLIPAKRQVIILVNARKLGKAVSPEDFFVNTRAA